MPGGLARHSLQSHSSVWPRPIHLHQYSRHRPRIASTARFHSCSDRPLVSIGQISVAGLQRARTPKGGDRGALVPTRNCPALRRRDFGLLAGAPRNGLDRAHCGYRTAGTCDRHVQVAPQRAYEQAHIGREACVVRIAQSRHPCRSTAGRRSNARRNCLG